MPPPPPINRLIIYGYLYEDPIFLRTLIKLRLLVSTRFNLQDQILHPAPVILDLQYNYQFHPLLRVHGALICIIEINILLNFSWKATFDRIGDELL